MARLDNLPIGGGMAPMRPPLSTPFSLSLDEGRGLIRCVLEGDWSCADADDFVAELDELMDALRNRSSRVRVLIDRRVLAPQSHAVAERLREANATLFGVDDRLAVVVESSLAKGQMRRLFSHVGSQAFLSDAAAELWLTAWR